MKHAYIFFKEKTICEQQNVLFTHSTTSGLIERRRRRDLNRTIPTSSSRKGEFLIVEKVIY